VSFITFLNDGKHELIHEPYISISGCFKDLVALFQTTDYSALPVIDEKTGEYRGIIRALDLLSLDAEEQKKNAWHRVIRNELPITRNEDLSSRDWEKASEAIAVIEEGKYIGYLPKEELVKIVLGEHCEINEQYRQVLDSCYNGILAINNKGEVIVYNPAAERILGYPAGDTYGRHISNIDPDTQLLETLLSGESAIGVKRKAGKEATILTNRTPLLHQGRAIGAVAVFNDISDLEKISGELDSYRKITEELNGIVESSYDGLYVVDSEGVVIRVNSSWEKITGFSRENVLGKNAKELVNSGMYDNSAALLTLEKKQTTTVMLEITSGTKKGQIIMATGTPIIDAQGEVSRVVVNVRDITYLENLKLQLEESMKLSDRYAQELEEIRIQNFKIEDVVARSQSMQKVLDLTIRVAKVDSTVIITGESGVGKEVIAKKIHAFSKRKESTLIKINCGAIPEHLLESELFGYESGAFTGAKKQGKPGMFELASGGTLFLDEIGDLPLSLQVKLLRVLQEKELIRVGGVKPIKVDARIIAATNKDLMEMVKKGEFRKDLYYRLNVVNIQIAPLRERKEDIVPLIDLILKKINQKYSMNKKVHQSAVELMLAYQWPGNVRELENTLERLVVLTLDNLIKKEDLPESMNQTKVSEKVISVNDIVPLRQAAEEMERQLLSSALERYKTTRQIAKILGVNQSTIVRKLQQYNLNESDAKENQNDGD